MVAGVVAEGPDTTLARVRIEAGGKENELSVLNNFVLGFETAPDNRVEVTVTSATAVLPERKISGEFGELLDDPLAKVALSKAPGDHVDTTLRGAVIGKGDAVTVYGAVESKLVAGQGYRDAPTEAITTIHAEVVALGDDAEALIEAWKVERQKALSREEAKRHERQAKAAAERAKRQEQRAKKGRKTKAPSNGLRLYGVWIILALTVGAAVVASTTSNPLQQQAFSALTINLLAAAVFLWRRRRWMPSFRKIRERASGTGYRWQTGIYYLFVSIVLLVFGLLMFTSVARDWAPLVSVAPVVAYLWALCWNDQRSAMRAWTLLRTKPMPAELPHGRFGAVEGRFAGQIAVFRKHWAETRTVNVTRTDSEGRSYQATEQRTTIHFKESWQGQRVAIDIGDATIEVAADGGYWAGFARVGNNQQLRVAAEGGDSILAAGRCLRDGDKVRFEVTGPGSLLMFTTLSDRSARTELRNQLLLHYLGLFALVCLGVAALSVWQSPGF